MLSLKFKIYVAAGVFIVVFFIGITAGIAWSNYKISKLEHAVTAARADADAKSTQALRLESESAFYKAKTEYLEQNLAEIQVIARKQDEQLEALNTDTNSARADVERARRVRAIGSTADELCGKLAEAGHPCE